MRSSGLALLAVTLGAASAAADPVHVPYRATLAGVEIAAGALTIEATGTHYRLSLDGVVTGEKAARARAHAAGRLARSGPMPDLYSADFDHAGQKLRVGLGFSNGALAMVAVLPPRAKGSGQTRPPQSQSYGLVDPLSALAVPAAAPHLAPLSACGRTQRVFDGVRRYELTLFPSRSEVVTIAGAPLSAIVCRAELRTGAASEQRRNPPRVERWQDGRGSQRALVWLAPFAGGRLLAPLRIEASLGYGTLTVEATDAQAFKGALFASAR